MTRRVRDAVELVSDIGGKAFDLQHRPDAEIREAVAVLRSVNGPMFDWLVSVLQGAVSKDSAATLIEGRPVGEGVENMNERSEQLARELRQWAEDDVLGMRRDVSMRRDQFVDDADLVRWAGLMVQAADQIEALTTQLSDQRASLQQVVEEMRIAVHLPRINESPTECANRHVQAWAVIVLAALSPRQP